VKARLNTWWLPPLVIVVILGAVYGLGSLHQSVSLAAGQRPQQPRLLPVTSAVRVCPDPGSAARPGSGIAVMSAPAGTGSQAAARSGSPATAAHMSVNRLAGTGSTAPGALVPAAAQPGSPLLVTVGTDRGGPRVPAQGQTGGQARGQANPKPQKGKKQPKPQATAMATVPATAARGGVVIQASGTLAQGLDVEQTAAGLPTAACGSPGTDFWFTGPGQRTAGQIQLYLMNPFGQVADAEVDIFTDAGPLEETTDAGINVPPHGTIVQTLGGSLHGSRAVTLHVRASAGQVVAAVRESTGAGPGTWLPAAQPPAQRLVIPGLPDMAGSRQLYVAVPGQKDATIQVTAVTSRGSYQPTGASGIDLPAGSAAEISLPSLSGIPAALRLTANTPVTAAMLIPGGAGGSPGSFTAATPALQEQGVIADNLVGPARSTSLVLSAPQRAARVTVVQVAGGGHQQSQQVTVGAGKSLVVQLQAVPGAPRGTPFAVVITPAADSGPVYAARVVSGNGAGGALQALQPVASALITVPLPTVRSAAITAAP
jgi:Family of unknown function (DUF5719)